MPPEGPATTAARADPAVHIAYCAHDATPPFKIVPNAAKATRGTSENRFAKSGSEARTQDQFKAE